MKKLLAFLAALCVALTVALPVLADDPTLPRVVDEADLLTQSEEVALAEMIARIRDEYSFDAVIVTANSLGGKSPMAYADDYYDYNGYGYGADADGILFLVSMEDRDYWFSTSGYGITVFTDYGIRQMGDAVVSYLSQGDYYEAFAQYLDTAESYLLQAQSGNPVDVKDAPYPSGAGTVVTDQRSALAKALGDWLVWLIAGIAVALISVGAMRAQLKSVMPRREAGEYMVPNSLKLAVSQDVFLYSTQTQTRIESSSGHSGGSSVHTGSSGRSHGGGGGKF